MPGVQFIRGLEMYKADEKSGQAQGEPLETLEVLAHGVIASTKHTIEFV